MQKGPPDEEREAAGRAETETDVTTGGVEGRGHSGRDPRPAPSPQLCPWVTNGLHQPAFRSTCVSIHFVSRQGLFSSHSCVTAQLQVLHCGCGHSK